MGFRHTSSARAPLHTLRLKLRLQLSNLDGLSSYIFGSRSKSGSLPVSDAFQQEVVGPSSRQLEQLVEEHRQWLASNCQSQVSNYRSIHLSAATAFPL